MTPTNLVEAAITEMYGERCVDFDKDCAGCQAWAQFDSLNRALQAAIEKVNQGAVE